MYFLKPNIFVDHFHLFINLPVSTAMVAAWEALLKAYFTEFISI